MSSLLSAFVFCSLSACVPTLPGGGAREPEIELPESYGGQATPREADSARADAQRAGVPPSSASIDWREVFTDPHLRALIEEALEGNQELNIAVQEILIANTEVMARRSEFLPTLGLGVGAGVERVGQHTSQGASDEMAELPQNLQDYRLGLYASWEIDIWRRLRNLRDAALQRYLASIEGRNFMVTRLVSEIATSYYELLALDRRLEVIEENIDNQRDALRAAQLEFQAARVTALAPARFEAELRNYQSREFEIRQQIVELETRLNLLVGRLPQPIERSSSDFFAIEPIAVASGLPIELLENRSDVRQAELGLSAASLDVRAARARFYPSISIEAGVGYESRDIRTLFATPTSILYNLAGNLFAPLLNRGGITAEYVAADAEQMRAVLTYERTVISAFSEVSALLTLRDNVAQSYALRTEQVEQLARSIDLSMQLFSSARADYLEVLTARRESIAATFELIETKLQQLSAAIHLYRALGGGWRPHASETESEDQTEQAPQQSERETQ